MLFRHRHAWLLTGLMCIGCAAVGMATVWFRGGGKAVVAWSSPADRLKSLSADRTTTTSEQAPAGTRRWTVGPPGAPSQLAHQERADVGSMPATAPALEDREPRPRFVRAEDRGEDFSLLPTSEVVRRLVSTNERVVRRKAARVLGDRRLGGKLILADGVKNLLSAYVSRQIQLTAAPMGEDRAEANDQIQRLWRLATSGVIDGLAEKNLAIVEAAMRNLALMRNQDIVATLVRRIEGSQDTVFRTHAVVALGMMRGKRDCLVPGRHTLGDEESEAIGTNVITPFLTRLETAEQDPQVRQAIKMAFELLRNPHDARPKPVGSPLPAQTRPAEGQ